MPGHPKRKPLPFYDSGIELEFGNFDKLNEKLDREWTEQIKRMRVIRSGFIVDGYQIERLLTEILLEVFYPRFKDERHNTKLVREQLRDTFEELIVQDLAFYKKIGLFDTLRKRTSIVANITLTGLRKRLDHVRDIRNRFAHCPIRFDVKGKPPKHSWFVKLVCKDKEIDLTSKYIFDTSMCFTNVSSELTKLLVALRNRICL
jgi:hypothetical protein